MLTITAILMLLAGCSNGSKIEWQTKELGPLTFEYPKDWVVPDLGDQFLAYISRESYRPARGLKDSVIILFGQDIHAEQSPRDFIEQSFIGESGKIVGESEELVGGYQAQRIEAVAVEEADEDNPEDYNVHTIAYEVDTQSPLAVVFLLQYKDGYKDDVDIFEHLLESVEFDPKKRQTL